MLIGTAIRNCHGYDQGGYLKSQMYGAVLYVRKKEFPAVGVLQSRSVCVHGWVQTEPASPVHDWSWPDSAGLCPAQCTQALSRFCSCGHSAVLAQLHKRGAGAGSCPASLECALTELMSD